jgi:hypothetical protein
MIGDGIREYGEETGAREWLAERESYRDDYDRLRAEGKTNEEALAIVQREAARVDALMQRQMQGYFAYGARNEPGASASAAPDAGGLRDPAATEGSIGAPAPTHTVGQEGRSGLWGVAKSVLGPNASNAEINEYVQKLREVNGGVGVLREGQTLNLPTADTVVSDQTRQQHVAEDAVYQQGLAERRGLASESHKDNGPTIGAVGDRGHDLASAPQVGRDASVSEARSTSVAPAAREVTRVTGTDGRTYLHSKDPDANGRFLFARSPLAAPPVNNYEGQLRAELGIFETKSTSEVQLVDWGDSDTEFFVLRSTSQAKAAAELDLMRGRLELGGGIGTASELVYAGQNYETPAGNGNVKVRSTVELSAGGGFAVDRTSRSADLGVKATVFGALLQADGNFVTDDVDLFFFNARIAAHGDLNAGSAGVTGTAGGSFRGGTGRLYFGAGVALGVGARGHMTLEVKANERFIDAAVTGISDVQAGRASIPEVLSRPEVNPLSNFSRRFNIGGLIYDWTH